MSEQGSVDRFKNHMSDEPASAASAAHVPLAALSSLLAVQETPSSTSDRHKAFLQGDTLLNELARIQVGLVQGWISEDTLQRLSALLSRPRPNLQDPSLNQVLDEIEVRAAVELAKLEGNPEQER